MRLTRAGEYAIRCMLYLSSHEYGAVISRKEIAEAMDIPKQFLTKIAQQLARVGVIEIVQGPKGGFRQLIDPENLTLLDVVEAVIGEIYLNDCILRPESCQRSPSCSVNQVWEAARTQLRNTLKSSTFRQLLDTQNCLNP